MNIIVATILDMTLRGFTVRIEPGSKPNRKPFNGLIVNVEYGFKVKCCVVSHSDFQNEVTLMAILDDLERELNIQQPKSGI